MTIALWVEGIQDWNIYYKAKSSLDNRKNILLQQTDVKEGDKWVGNSKAEWVYDNHNNELSKATYSWDKDLNDWRKLLKYETKYNDRDSIVLKCKYSFAYPDNEWRMTQKEKYTFDENNNRIMEVLSSYDGVFDYMMKEVSKTEFTFDLEGHKLKEVYYGKSVMEEKPDWIAARTTTYYYSNYTDIATTSVPVWILSCYGLEISVSSNCPTIVQVYAMDGKLVVTGMDKVKVPVAGIYIVCVNGVSQKVMVKG